MFAQSPASAAESASEFNRARVSLYERVSRGEIEGALTDLGKRPVPIGTDKEVFVARELSAVGFAAVNQSDSVTAARAAREVVGRLTVERIRSLSTRSDRVTGYRLVAQLWERVLAEPERGHEAWTALLQEQPDDEQARAAVRKFELQAELRAKRQSELARDTLKKGFVPVAAPKP